MKITIVGAGRVGGTLGARLGKLGHEITFVVRDKSAEKSAELSKLGAKLFSSKDIAQATADSEAIIFALPWNEMESTVKAAGPLDGKVVIDATNPLELSETGLSKGLLIGHNTSAGEELARWIPKAKVSKAFNTIGFEVMQNPIIDGEAATLLICGDSQSNKVAAKLAGELGFAPVEVGDIKLARLIEPYGMLWIHLRFALGWSPDFALVAKRASASVR